MDSSSQKVEYQKVKSIAMAMIIGCLMFAGVVYFMISQPGSSSMNVDQLKVLRYPLWIISAIFLMIIPVVKKNILKQNFTKETANKNSDQAKKMAMVIVPIAMCEGVVIFNLVVALILKSPSDLIMALVIGLIGFGMHFPKNSDWESNV